MTDDADDTHLIAQIRQQLERDRPDAGTRAALQQARIRALSGVPARVRPAPWLGFALAASLLAVVFIVLPGKPAGTDQRLASQNGKTDAVATTKQRPGNTAIGKGPTQQAAKPPVTPAPDLDLLENLELYEDTEFYEWLSEQDGQGGLDA